jgi:hypothetical protein
LFLLRFPSLVVHHNIEQSTLCDATRSVSAAPMPLARSKK